MLCGADGADIQRVLGGITLVVWSRICIAETVEMILADRAVEREHELAEAVRRSVAELNVVIENATREGMDIKLDVFHISACSGTRPIASVVIRGSVV